ncbi:hypothetical protein GE118_01260 [Mycoplasma sp. NEAQ87857]|uniref:MnuA family membrane nuclease n=1 Tax=Mycoplasma sp. NEAQ87857 TaxID=2683967 RepID=UPI0013160526|nr:hypothetical protein [Mycoplasma sp. NEAQ87857]QGZ97422.1 hypothetical protein GE118_01260 [Mycoplasma sp. NEAQ87857]
MKISKLKTIKKIILSSLIISTTLATTTAISCIDLGSKKSKDDKAKDPAIEVSKNPNNQGSKDQSGSKNNENKTPKESTGETNTNPKTPINKDISYAELEKESNFVKDSNRTRILHWNILNYGGEKSTALSSKVYNIATALFKSNADIMGLTEVNYDDGPKVARIVKWMNDFAKVEKYSFKFQPIDQALNKDYKTSKEQIAIIYNNQTVEPVNFNNNKMYDSFKGPIKKVESNDDVVSVLDADDSFVRPLFGMQFRIKNNNKLITTFFGHFDSPGVKANSNETPVKGILDGTYEIKNQGSKEISEAIGLIQAFEFFKSISNSNNIIFGGDTNIKEESASIFDYVNLKSNTQSFYPSNIANNTKFLTSLTTANAFAKKKNHSGYSNSYDKWVFKEGDIDFRDYNEEPNFWFKIDIVKGFKNHLFNKEITAKKYKDLYKKSTSDFNLIRNISDHAPIIIDAISK